MHLQYVTRRTDLLASQVVWVIRLNQASAPSVQTLLLSKSSEAILPRTHGNAQGPGSTMADIVHHQPGIRLILNGGYNHYRHDFYDWPHQTYHVGDPVGFVKIREHIYHDALTRDGFGYFVQEDKGLPWRILGSSETPNWTHKYILGCTPLLLDAGLPTSLEQLCMTPVEHDRINPPSYLGHGMQVHPRTAVGTCGDDLVFIVVENNPQGTGGCTLAQLQGLGVSLGLEYMLNLDGGGSSQFWYWDDTQWVRNYVHPDDRARVLGNTIILFDATLSQKTR